MVNIKQYIGYIIGSNGETGSFLVIGKNKVVTAAHVIRPMESPIRYFLNDREIAFTGQTVNYKNELAVILSNTEVFPTFCPEELKINIFLSPEYGDNTPWKCGGYLPRGGEIEFQQIRGRSFSEGGEEYPVVLLDCILRSPSIVGMSGSPVVINDMVVGILQAEDLNNDGIVENLYLSPISDIVDDLDEQCIQPNIFMNQKTEKRDYSEQYKFDDYIPRKIQMIDRPEPDVTDSEGLKALDTLIDLVCNPQKDHLFVLLGEAGLGKTLELQQLAVNLYDSKYFPLLFSLKDFFTTERLDNQIVGLEDYIRYRVPFCLILDGFDEIKDTHYRDTVFPQVILSFINRVEEKYRESKTPFTVVLSSRRNYYYEGKINRAISVILSDLTLDDVDAVLKKHTVNEAEFMKEVWEKRLNTFILNPFYLLYIIKLYLADKGILPESKNLMSMIICHLFQDKNFEKYRGQPLKLTKENTKGKMLLSKISACYIIQGKMKLSYDEIIQLTDGYLDGTELDLAENTGIIDKDGEENWVFKHHNFCEYLAAEFFKDLSFKQLLDIIAYESRDGIYNNYLNMTAYLLQIRENSDLSDWIIESCPDIYPNIERHHLTPELSLSILKSVNRLANEKAYYLITDFALPIQAIINNEPCIGYLLDIVNKSKNERELLSALRMIGDLNDLCDMGDRIREILLSFLVSDRCNHHHIRDTIYALTELDLGNEAVTKLLVDNYANSQDEEILRGINFYAYTYDVADVFINALVFQMINIDYSHYLGAYFQECLRIIKEENSFIKVFSALLDIDHSSHYFFHSLETTETLASCNEKLIMLRKTSECQELVNIVLNLSAALIGEYVVKDNPFAVFFNSTDLDTVAIEFYFDRLCNDPVAFQTSARDLKSYDRFLLEGYELKRFFDNSHFMFEYCMRCFPKESDTRKKGLELVSTAGYDNAEASIGYITGNDDHAEKEKAKRIRLKTYVFNISKLIDDLSSIIHDFGAEDPCCGDLVDFVYDTYEYNSPLYVAYSFAREVFYGKEKIQSEFDYYNDNPDEYVIASFKYFIAKFSDFDKYITDEEQEEVLVKAKEYLAKVNFAKCDRMILKDAVSLLQQFEFPLPEPLFIKLLQLPDLYYVKYSAKGFPDYVIDHLSHEIIIDHIERCIHDENLDRYSCESFLSYCDSTSYVSDNMVQLARRVLNNEFSDGNHYRAWDYLLHIEKADLIIEQILKGTISKSFAVYQLPTLLAYNDKNLSDWALALFEELNEVYLTGVTEENVDELVERYGYLIRYDNASDKESKLKTNLLDAIRCLFAYLFKYDVSGSVDLYLDSMLEQKKTSYLENTNYETLTAKIESPVYLEKLITLLEMLFDGSFSSNRKGSNLYGDIRTAILSIGREQPDETIRYLSRFSNHSNTDFKRAIFLLIDNLYKDKYENQNKIYSIAETRVIVFSH